MKYVYPLFLLLGLTCIGACSSDHPTPITSNPIPHEVKESSEAYLHLSISHPNSVSLRSGSLNGDPLQQIDHLSFVFYTNTSSPEVAEVRHLGITTPSQLENITLRLTPADYKLVVLANGTSALRQLINKGRSLNELTEPRELLTSQLLPTSASSALTLPLLNDQGSVAISSQSFSSSPTAASSIAPIRLEAMLARVIVYGEPSLQSGTKGNATTQYLISNVSTRTSPLRALGLLSTGDREVAQDNSPLKNRYAQGWLHSKWSGQTPTSSGGVGSYTSSSMLDPTSPMWIGVPPTLESIDRNQRSLYTKESVLPGTATLQGIAPCVVVSYPYIPEGLTLAEGEGWVSYQGKNYSEHAFKNAIEQKARSRQSNSPIFDDAELDAATTRAQLSVASFATAFDREGIRFYHQSRNYYVVYIRHFDDNQTSQINDEGRYGIVRNNEYRIQLRSISGAGMSVPPELKDNLDPISEWQSTKLSVAINGIEHREQNAEL